MAPRRRGRRADASRSKVLPDLQAGGPGRVEIEIETARLRRSRRASDGGLRARTVVARHAVVGGVEEPAGVPVARPAWWR